MYSTTELMYRNQLMALVKRLSRRGFFTFSNYGSVSIKNPDTGDIYITPAKTAKFNIKDWCFLRAEDLVRLSAAGEVEEKFNAEPSIEKDLHMAIYAARPEMNAIAHIFSENVSSFAAKGEDMLPVMVEDVKTEIGGDNGVVRSVPNEAYCSDEYVKSILEGMRDKKKAVFITNCGAVCIEKNSVELNAVCEILERQATMEIDATIIGNIDRIDVEMTIDESIRPIRRRV